MSHPGRVGEQYVCDDCGAEMQVVGGIIRCPWSTPPMQVEAGRLTCGKPYGTERSDDIARAYDAAKFGRNRS